jgi:hypothetical protein
MAKFRLVYRDLRREHRQSVELRAANSQPMFAGDQVKAKLLICAGEVAAVIQTKNGLTRRGTMEKYHVAQVNIGRIRAPLDDAIMAGFMGRLDEINALADRSPGFVWRLQTSQGNATYFRPYEHDDRILLNMSVWETVEALRNYVYNTAHKELLKNRHEWFEKFVGTYTSLWWVPVGHRPGIDEAKKRLAHLEKYGPTEFAFTFKNIFKPNEEFQRGIDWAGFEPCPAG